jgi:hypothetical protein
LFWILITKEKKSCKKHFLSSTEMYFFTFSISPKFFKKKKKLHFLKK